ncbi:TPA: hypothetical protein ACH3X1_006808 [Trebouxia sp. C0004]
MVGASWQTLKQASDGAFLPIQILAPHPAAPHTCPTQSAMLVPGQSKLAACTLPQDWNTVTYRALESKAASWTALQAAKPAGQSALTLHCCSLQHVLGIMPNLHV